MNKYTIYCTPEQIKKALELGAPIKRRSDNYDPSNRYFRFELHSGKYGGDGYYYVECLTTEQLIGWLEEQKIYFSINCIGDYVYEIWTKDNNNNGKVITNSCAPSRKKATLAAIDAALDYLSKRKK